MEQSQQFITKLFINGQFVDAKSGKTFQTYNPATEEIIAQVQQAGNEDVDLAVAAARQAFDNGSWTNILPIQRAKLLLKLADLIESHTDELAKLQALNNGKTFIAAKYVDLPGAIKTFRYYAGWVDKIRGQVIPANGPYHIYTTKQPVGVVGQVIPWNFPLTMLSWKIAPALAAGCTIVLKSAEQTPLTALKFAELVQKSGIPKGVVNIISGFGATGAYLVQHKNVDKVGFTGSTQVGYHIMRNCHKDNLKRITLQLGGKSPNIVTQNANLQKAVGTACLGLFFNSGQCCNAGSRVFVHEKIYDEFILRVIERSKQQVVGDQFNQKTTIGALVSKQQLDRVLNYIDIGKKQNARLVLGGNRIGQKGYFVEPTIFADVTDDMTIAKQQIFGPVMCILKYSTNEQAIKRANDHRYGLAAAVITQNLEQAHYFTKRLRVGSVYVNAYHILEANTPFGGFRDSGIGRELGEQGLNIYLESKTISTYIGN